MTDQYKCEVCKDTGYYGDNGPGIKGNRTYHPCDMPIHRKTNMTDQYTEEQLREARDTVQGEILRNNSPEAYRAAAFELAVKLQADLTEAEKEIARLKERVGVLDGFEIGIDFVAPPIKSEVIEKAARQMDCLSDESFEILTNLYDSAVQNEREAIRTWIKTEIGPYGDCRTGCYEMLVGDFNEYFPCVRKESTTNGQ